MRYTTSRLAGKSSREMGPCRVSRIVVLDSEDIQVSRQLHQIWPFPPRPVSQGPEQSFGNKRLGPSAVKHLSVGCRLWWNPPFALLGGPKVFLHTVFQLEDTPQVQQPRAAALQPLPTRIQLDAVHWLWQACIPCTSSVGCPLVLVLVFVGYAGPSLTCILSQ